MNSALFRTNQYLHERAQAMTQNTITRDLLALGFHVEHTGGGCTALRLDLPNGGYIMVTDELSHEITHGICIGIYRADDENVAFADTPLTRSTGGFHPLVQSDKD
jgi:hypothetical protein